MSNKNDALVSVVIPTYNRSYCVFRAIDSVRAQTHQNWEVVLVDDGSTDDTAAMISARYGQEPRVRYLQQANAGVSAARNTGIAAAQGDYIAFLDSDDVWKPWKLELQLDCFRRFPEVGMVWTNFEAVDADRKVVNPRYLTTMYQAYRNFESFERLFGHAFDLAEVTSAVLPDAQARGYMGDVYPSMLRGNLVHTSTVLIARERFEKVGGFNVNLALSGEDYDFHFRTCKWGKVCLADVASTEYQVGYDDQLTRYSKQVALNSLKTAQLAIAREKDTGVFSKEAIAHVLAKDHAWVAQELFESGDYAGVREHAGQSLRYKSWQPRLWFLFVLASLPRAISKVALGAYRRVKP